MELEKKCIRLHQLALHMFTCESWARQRRRFSTGLFNESKMTKLDFFGGTIPLKAAVKVKYEGTEINLRCRKNRRSHRTRFLAQICRRARVFLMLHQSCDNITCCDKLMQALQCVGAISQEPVCSRTKSITVLAPKETRRRLRSGPVHPSTCRPLATPPPIIWPLKSCW